MAQFGSMSGALVVVAELLNRVQLFWEPMDCGLLGSSVHGISQARVLKWVAISFSNLPTFSRLSVLNAFSIEGLFSIYDGFLRCNPSEIKGDW